MFEQDIFHFGSGNVVAAADDEVVVPALIPEISIAIAPVHVARDVPAVSHVLALAIRLAPVAAAGRPAHRQQALRAWRDVFEVFVDHPCLVPGHRGARRSGPDSPLAGRDEDVKHLGGSDAVEDVDARPPAPFLVNRRRKGLAGADAHTQ